MYFVSLLSANEQNFFTYPPEVENSKVNNKKYLVVGMMRRARDVVVGYSGRRHVDTCVGDSSSLIFL